jgi:dimethylargininase
MLIAITRAVSRSIANCELTFLERTPIDFERARQQHLQYEQALKDLGVAVLSLPEQPDLPDSVFVEDVALVLDECAVMTRPGAESRRLEVESVAAALRPYRHLSHIEAPARLDGGDVLRLGRKIYVGLSQRSDPNAIEQLQDLLAHYGYEVQAVPVTGCLHLKSAVTQVGAETLLLNPAWVDRHLFGDVKTIEVDASEPYAANALLIGDAVIYPTSFPKTTQRLSQAGIRVVAVEADELAKAEGAVTCCSLVLWAERPA